MRRAFLYLNTLQIRLKKKQKNNNIHFIPQVFSQFEDFKQQHHLSWVLQDFGILLREQAVEPAPI